MCLQPGCTGTQSEPLWSHPFEATVRVKLLPGQLTLHLWVRNGGNTPMPFTAALHGYLATGGRTSACVHHGRRRLALLERQP